ELQTSATNVLTGPAENRILLLAADAQTARALQEALATRWIVEIGDASAAITAASPFAAALVADSGLLQAHDWWLLGWLRRNPATADTLIIALTGAGAPDTAALCLSAGADDCVAYPVSARELEARVVAKLGVTREREDPLRAVQALRQRLAAAEAVNQAKDWLVTTLGHELRSPLSTISSALELMRVVGNDGGNQAVIERQVRHMIRLVEDLTDVTRIKGGNMTLSKERVELGSVVQSAVELVSPL